MTVDYLDDFSQPQRITQMLTVEVGEPMEVIEGPEGGGGGGGGGIVDEPLPQEPESFWDKVVRFFKGLFGLDSGPEVPAVEPSMPQGLGPSKPVPAPAMKG